VKKDVQEHKDQSVGITILKNNMIKQPKLLKKQPKQISIILTLGLL
jgi:GTP cyclohydrolase II